MNLTMQSWSFESDPTDKNASDFNTAKEKLALFYEKHQGAIIGAGTMAMVGTEKRKSTVKRERNISYTSGVAAIKPGINRNFG